jgi:hypothetical protein
MRPNDVDRMFAPRAWSSFPVLQPLENAALGVILIRVSPDIGPVPVQEQSYQRSPTPHSVDRSMPKKLMFSPLCGSSPGEQQLQHAEQCPYLVKIFDDRRNSPGSVFEFRNESQNCFKLRHGHLPGNQLSFQRSQPHCEIVQLLVQLPVREQRGADAAERAYDLPNRLVAHLSMTAEPAPPAMRTSVSHLVYEPREANRLWRRCVGPASRKSQQGETSHFFRDRLIGGISIPAAPSEAN